MFTVDSHFQRFRPKGSGLHFFSSLPFFFSHHSEKFKFQYRLHAVHIPITYSPQLEASLLILALNSIKISADLISTPSIIYLFLLIFSLTLSFISFLTKISTSHTYATQFFYPQTQICKVQEAFYMKRKVLCVCKGLSTSL